MYVGVYVCICVCMYVWMYVCVNVCVYVYVYICIYVCVYVHNIAYESEQNITSANQLSSYRRILMDLTFQMLFLPHSKTLHLHVKTVYSILCK